MIRSLLAALCLMIPALPAAAQEVRVRGGFAAAEAVDGLEAPIFARGLGEISDLALAEDGTVFATDARSGRIWVMRDRARDGRADTVQALPHRFDQPTGLASRGDTLFVADRGGLWAIRGGLTPRLVAPFQNSGALPAPHPVAIQPDGTLRLGLPMPDGTSRIVSVRPDTGEATPLAEWPGRIAAFSKGPFGAPGLTLLQDGATTRLGGFGAQPQALPSPARAAWVDAEAGVVLLSGPDGLRAHRATLMGLETDPDVLLRGVEGGAVVMDGRGILLASPQDGTIRVVRPRREVALPKVETAPAPEPQLDSDLLILRGSGIDRASRYDEIRDSATETE